MPQNNYVRGKPEGRIYLDQGNQTQRIIFAANTYTPVVPLLLRVPNDARRLSSTALNLLAYLIGKETCAQTL